MNHNNYLELATRSGLLDEIALATITPDLYRRIGQLAGLAYQQGLADANPTLPDFTIENDNEEVVNFRVGGVLMFSANHDDHGWDGVTACRNLFINTATHLGMEA